MGPLIRREGGGNLEWTQVITAFGDFVTLRLIRGCALGPLQSSTLGGKTSFPILLTRPTFHGHLRALEPTRSIGYL